MLNEISQTEKGKYFRISFTPVEYLKKWTATKILRETSSKLVVTRGDGGEREGEMGTRGQLAGDRWKLDFWWWARYSIFRCWMVMLQTQNLHDVANQCWIEILSAHIISQLVSQWVACVSTEEPALPHTPRATHSEGATALGSHGMVVREHCCEFPVGNLRPCTRPQAHRSDPNKHEMPL